MAWLIRLANDTEIEVAGDAPLSSAERAEIEAQLSSTIVKIAALASSAPANSVTEATAAAERTIPTHHNSATDGLLEIAIVGMAGRFPGAASVDELWNLLARGIDPIGEIPSTRWLIDDYFDPRPAVRGKTNSRWSGLLNDIELFDAGLFGIAPREAQLMDPQHRLLLETCWQTLEHAGYGGRAMAGAAVGVFVGASGNEYLHRFLGQPQLVERYLGSGNALSMIANRLSFQFDFKGPSLTVDTACSSSLVAVHLACQSLARGECEAAIAGGVNVLLAPEMYVNCSQARMLAADGRSKTFDQRADGYVRSEGVALVMLKPLATAMADGDTVHAVIRATAVNQDGRTSGLTVPSGAAQSNLLRRIYQPGALPVESISYLEAHGTGTALGDPIEVSAAGTVFGAVAAGQRCAIGSLKSNLGHLEAAAGIASLIKVVLALRHRQLPPTLHLSSPNEHIRFEESPFFIVDRLTPWRITPGAPRRAGISAFGFGGTNAHAVLEEAPQEVYRELDSTPRAELFVLSARSLEALARLVTAHIQHLSAEPVPGEFQFERAAISDICFTLQTGRAALPNRLAIVASSRAELLEKLTALSSRAFNDNARPGSSGCFSSSQSGDANPGAAIDEARRRLTIFGSDVTAIAASMARGLVWEEQFASGSVGSLIPATPGQLSANQRQQLLELLGVLFAAGINFDWRELHAGESPRRVPLPAYAFDHRRYWMAWPTAIDRTAVDKPNTESETREPAATGTTDAQAHVDRIRESSADSSTKPNDELLKPSSGLANCCYAQRWVEAAAAQPRDLAFGTWLLFADELGVAEELGARLRKLGQRTVLVRPTAHFNGVRGLDDTRQHLEASVAPGDCADLKGLLAAVNNEQQPLVGVVHAWLLNAPANQVNAEATVPLGDLAARGPLSLFALARSLGGNAEDNTQSSATSKAELGNSASQPLELWLLTAGTAQVDTEPSAEGRSRNANAIAPGGGALRAYGAVLAREYSNVTVRHVDLQIADGGVLQQTEQIWQEFHAEVAHDSIALRMADDTTEPTGRRFTPVLLPYNPPAISPSSRHVDPTARYLVTGGLGFVGLQLAQALIDDGARSLVLLSRTELPAESEFDNGPSNFPGDDLTNAKIRAVQALRASGAVVRIVGGDVADLAFVRRLVDDLDTPASRLAGIVHAAGVLNDGLICTRAQSDLLRILRPKVWGAEAIRQITGGRRLDWIVLCSSTASLKAEPGHAAYAAANAYLDLVGHQIRNAGIPCSVLNWGPWVGAQSASAGGYRRLMARREADDLTPTVALEAFRYAIAANERQLAVIQLTTAKREQLRSTIDELVTPNALVKLRWREAITTAAVQFAIDTSKETLVAAEQAVAAIDQSCADFIENLLARKKLFQGPGDCVSRAAIAEHLGVKPKLLAALPGLLQLLVDDGVLELASSGYLARRPLEVRNPSTQLVDVKSRFPQLAGALDLLDRCGNALGDVLAGRRDILELLFAPGRRSDLQSIYAASPWTAPLQRALARVVAGAAAYATPARPLRILEVGAGTGGTTAHLLSNLSADTFEFTFTDVSPRLVREAQSRFARSGMHFTVFDLEQPFASQGFSDQSFDVIVAADVVHATRRLDESLNQLARLLMPGGLLVLLEATRVVRFSQLTFGLTEGWWRFLGDPLRSHEPLLPPNKWLEMLTSHGFDAAAAFPDPVPQYGARDHHVLLARRASLATPGLPLLPSVATSKLHPNQASLRNEPSIRRTASRDARHTWLELLKQTFASILELPIEELDVDRPFHEQGLDSLMVLEVIESLRSDCDVLDIGPATFFEHPTLIDLATALATRHGSSPTLRRVEPADQPESAEAISSSPNVVIAANNSATPQPERCVSRRNQIG
jgi:rhizoxin synthesis polyketide synthase RhiC